MSLPSTFLIGPIVLSTFAPAAQSGMVPATCVVLTGTSLMNILKLSAARFLRAALFAISSIFVRRVLLMLLLEKMSKFQTRIAGSVPCWHPAEALHLQWFDEAY
jgi:hypothetical protein